MATTTVLLLDEKREKIKEYTAAQNQLLLSRIIHHMNAAEYPNPRRRYSKFGKRVKFGKKMKGNNKYKKNDQINNSGGDGDDDDFFEPRSSENLEKDHQEPKTVFEIVEYKIRRIVCATGMTSNMQTALFQTPITTTLHCKRHGVTCPAALSPNPIHLLEWTILVCPSFLSFWLTFIDDYLHDFRAALILFSYDPLTTGPLLYGYDHLSNTMFRRLSQYCQKYSAEIWRRQMLMPFPDQSVVHRRQLTTMFQRLWMLPFRNSNLSTYLHILSEFDLCSDVFKLSQNMECIFTFITKKLNMEAIVPEKALKCPEGLVLLEEDALKKELVFQFCPTSLLLSYILPSHYIDDTDLNEPMPRNESVHTRSGFRQRRHQQRRRRTNELNKSIMKKIIEGGKDEFLIAALSKYPTSKRASLFTPYDQSLFKTACQNQFGHMLLVLLTYAPLDAEGLCIVRSEDWLTEREQQAILSLCEWHWTHHHHYHLQDTSDSTS